MSSATASPHYNMMITTSETTNRSDEQKDFIIQINEQIPSLTSRMIELAGLINSQIDSKNDPTNALRELNHNLDRDHRMIFLEINADAKMKVEFYKVVLKGISTKLLAEKSVSEYQYLNQILRFFRNILVNFFPQDLQDESLAEIVYSLFNLDAHLYTVALQSGSAKTLLGLSNSCFQTLLKEAFTSDRLNQEQEDQAAPREIVLTSEQEDLLTKEQKRVISELPWRQRLKIGDRLDCILQCTTESQHKSSHWTRATIIQFMDQEQYQQNAYYFDAGQQIDSSASQYAQRFRVQYDGIFGTDGKKYFNSISLDIAPPETFTDDFDWRSQMKAGDSVDCMDTEGIWYRSTVLDTRETPQSDNELGSQPIKEVYIGYRYYSEEEGHKTDDDGRKYVGWSQRYDAWVPIYSSQIHRLNTVSKFYKVAGRNSMIYETVGADDGLDSLFNTKQPKCWAVSRANHFQNLKCIADFVNEFGERGGFENILALFNGKMTQNPISVAHISYLMEFLLKINPLLTRQFIIYYTPKIKNAFLKVIMSGPLSSKFPKEKLQGAQKAFTGVLKRYYPSTTSGSPIKSLEDNYHMIESDMIFCVACNLLKSEKLEQRVSGLNQINEQIKPKFGAYRRGLSEKDMLLRLRENKVIDIIFGNPESTHIQLVQRGAELLKFILDQRELTEADLLLVWNAGQRGEEQTKLEIYKIFKDLQTKLTNPDTEKLIRLFAEKIDPAQFILEELECVAALTQYGHRGTPAGLLAAELFWDIAIQKRPYPKDIVENAIDKLISLLKTQEREVKMTYISNAYDQMGERRSTLQAVRVMAKIIDDIPSYKVSNLATNYEVASELISKYGILNIVIQDLKTYVDAANIQWERGIIKKENIDTVEMFNLPFTHRSNIANRLSFIRQLLHLSIRSIESEQLDLIWDILVTNSKISTDQQYFFEWFQGLLNESGRVSFDLIQNFFESKVCTRTEQGSFNSIMKSGFECIQTMFLQVNELYDKLYITSLPNQQMMTKLDFIVHTAPKNLQGIEIFWKILQECDKKNIDLTTIVVDLLTKLYHNISTQIATEDVLEIQDQFCQECLNQMNIAAQNKSSSDDEKKLFIKTSVAMIKSFLYESEKNGMGNLRYHSGLDRGEYLERVVLQNMESHSHHRLGAARLVEISTYSNMTAWELKKITAQKFMISPLCLELRRNDPKKTQFNDINHHRLLRDFKIESHEIIQVWKKTVISIARVKLLNKKGELIPEARGIFSSWFKRFSNQDGFMTPKECADFIKTTTNNIDDFISMNDRRIVDFFSTYALSNPGLLTEEEFLEFYKRKSNDKPEVVWQNLSVMKYGGDLKPVTSQNNPDDPRELKNVPALPRSKLSVDQNNFKSLINLLGSLPPSSQEELWPLLGQLRTNIKAYAEILQMTSIESLSVKSNSIFEVLYQLQIIDSLVNEFQVKKEQQMKIYYAESSLDTTKKDQYPALGDASANEENKRDVQAAAPESGAAIPLPMATNVPEPPSIKVPFIGPQLPNSNQTSANNNTNSVAESQHDMIKKVNELVSQFKGPVLTEQINSQVFRDEELAETINCSLDQVASLRQKWAENFVKQGGFKALMTLLSDLHHHCKSLPQVQDVLKSKAERDCWNQLLKLLKVILMSTFIPNLPQIELSLALSHRMNSNTPATGTSNANASPIEESKEYINTSSTAAQPNQGSATDAQGPTSAVPPRRVQVVIDQENTTKLYGPLMEVMSGEAGAKILEQLDFQQVQTEIMSMIHLILCKKDTNYEEKQIIELGISLWISEIIFNPQLLQTVFDEWNAIQQSQVSTTNDLSFTKILVVDGLLSSNSLVRNVFKENLKFISESVRSQALTEQPYIFFLRVLLSQNDMTKGKPRESQHFYQLLIALLQLYLRQHTCGDQVQLFDNYTLLGNYVKELIAYQSFEDKNKSLMEDYNLSGYIKIIHELISHSPGIISESEQQSLADLLISKILFCFHIDPVEEDITKNIDLSSLEKPYLNKAHSLSTRRVAYGLLQTLCSSNPDLIPTLISAYFSGLLSQVKKPKKAGYQPRLEYRTNGYCGLKNLGSICYMNSMIQQFFNVPTFRYSILSAQNNAAPQMVDFEGDQINDDVMYQIMKMTSFLELSERQDYNPREFCYSYKGDGQPTNVRLQQDASEFLSVFLDRIEIAQAKTPHKYLAQNVFGGKTCSVMICKGCGNIRQSYDNFYNLSLEVKNQRNIYDGLTRFVSGETINDFKCEACNNRVDVERKTLVHKLPNTLIIHLQRIVFDMDIFMNKKLNSRVEFPNVLNMRQFMKDEVLKGDKETMERARREQKKAAKKAAKLKATASRGRVAEEGKDEDGGASAHVEMSEDEESSAEDEVMQDETANVPERKPDENFDYKLVGVILHMGTADAGHYLSYININREAAKDDPEKWLQTDQDKWLEFNDTLIKEYKFSNLETDCFGGANPNAVAGEEMVDYSRNAYMLVYEKRVKEDMKIVVPSGMIQVTPEDEESGQSASSHILASQAAQEQWPDALKVLKSFCHEIRHDQWDHLKLYYDPDAKEYYTLADFNAIEKFVPNNLYKLVHKDNHNFLFERQIFTAGFFDAIKNILQILFDKNPLFFIKENSKENAPVFQFMEKLLFDILAMTSENKLLVDIARQYTQMLQKNPEECFRFIDRRILMKDREAKDQREFFETLVSHMDKDVREMNQVILLSCLNMCFQSDDEERIDMIMNNVFSLIPDDLTKNWLKIHQYLTFLFETVKSGKKQVLYMMKHNLIAKLIDFFLENESPMVTGQVSKAAKKRQVMGSNYARAPLENLILTISYIVRQQEIVHYSNEQPPMSYFPQKSFLQLNIIEQPLPPLSDKDIYMLRRKEFIERGLRANYESLEFVRLLTHLCYQNFQFSRIVAKKAILGMNKASADEVQNYIYLIGHLLSLDDQHRHLRPEWLLGIPQIKLEKAYNLNNNQPVPPYRLGVSSINRPDEEVIEYRSTLFKTSSSIKESFLQVIVSQRKRWTKFTLDAILALLQICFNDASGFIYQYIYSMDPPTYCQARYLDWIKPYLQEQIENCLKYYSIPLNQIELQIAFQASQLLEQLIARFPYSGELQRQIQALNQEQIDLSKNQKVKKRVFNYDLSQDTGTQQYVMWNIINTTIKNQSEILDGLIELEVKEYVVRITDSQPDGETNKVFPASLFPNYVPPSQQVRTVNFVHTGFAQQSGSGGTSSNWGRGARNFGRGKTAQYQPVVKTRSGASNHHSKSKRSHQGGKGRGNQKREMPPNQDIETGFQSGGDEFESEDARDSEDMEIDVPSNQGSAGDDENSRPVHGNSPVGFDSAAANSQHSQDGPQVTGDAFGVGKAAAGESASNNDDFATYADPQEAQNAIAQANNQANQQEDEVVILTEGSVPHAAPNAMQMNQQDPQASPSPIQNQEEDQQMMDYQVQEEELVQWEAPLSCLLVFTLTNNHQNQAYNVNLKLRYVQGDNQANNPPNERIPFSGMPFLVMPGKSRDCLVLHKLRPFDEWGSFRWDFSIEDRNQEYNPYSNEENPIPDVIPDPFPDLEPMIIACSVCTLENDPIRDECEACGTKLAK